MFVDSHCHLNMLDLSPFQDDLQQVLNQAHENQVEHILSVAVTLTDHPTLTEIAQKFKNVSISAGVHPNEQAEQLIDQVALQQACSHPKVIAVGETGLDYYRSNGDLQWQRQRFVQHIECAQACQKPLIIHTRAAQKDTLEIMRLHAKNIGGVMHCFTEDWEMAKQALDLGFYISFSGIVTFKNATQIQAVAKKVPLDRMLIETDAPYLAPVPHRGKSNLPAYVRHVAEFIAQLRQEAVELIGEQTTRNFFTLFAVKE